MTPFILFAAIYQTSTLVGQKAFPTITAEAAIVVHADSGRILWGRNVDLPMYPASTTKLLTTLILLENLQTNETIEAPLDTERVKGSTLHLKPGEQITAEGAAYALMLRSANDVGYAVAKKLGGSEEGFAKMMNAYSKSIGMTSSHWVTPHGLNNPWHKTTARDLSILGMHALKNHQLVKITSTTQYTIQRSINQKDTLLESKNRLLKSDPTIKGFKTGFTNPAGLCFIGYHQTPNGEIVTVLLNSKDWANDQSTLIKWIGEKFTPKSNILANLSVTLKSPNARDNTQFEAESIKPIPALVSDEDIAGLKIIPTKTTFNAPIQQNTRLTDAKILLPDGTEFSTTLMAKQDVEAKFDLGETLRSPLAMSFILLASAGYWYRRRAYDRFSDLS